MDPSNWPIFPWSSLELANIFTGISSGLCFLVMFLYFFLSYRLKEKLQIYKYLFAHLITFSLNIFIVFNLFWYISVPLSILVSSIIYRLDLRDLSNRSSNEINGGITKSYKPGFILFVISIILPILITLILWKLNIGYRFINYPLI